jgi:hypothetical protein
MGFPKLLGRALEGVIVITAREGRKGTGARERDQARAERTTARVVASMQDQARG